MKIAELGLKFFAANFNKRYYVFATNSTNFHELILSLQIEIKEKNSWQTIFIRNVPQ
jgi:hypothetical protein